MNTCTCRILQSTIRIPCSRTPSLDHIHNGDLTDSGGGALGWLQMIANITFSRRNIGTGAAAVGGSEVPGWGGECRSLFVHLIPRLRYRLPLPGFSSMSKVRGAIVELLSSPWTAATVFFVAGMLGWGGVAEAEAARTTAAFAAVLVAVGTQMTACVSVRAERNSCVVVRSTTQGLRYVYSPAACCEAVLPWSHTARSRVLASSHLWACSGLLVCAIL